ncbi:ABC-ATPase domain-containing protein [Paraliobacillus sp. X-1268]|uniref:ABC-ATPase domain-containing protein n=1 Tax=Paraliobacillus sp. X-1268 TaxID=2213193 RepID=UPI000E3BE52E|nr:ABC-ATPase domain-containing protein [Paraliobacillus sp. X-1268]
MKQLQEKLQQIDGKGYKAYKSIYGRYSFHRFELCVDYVQGDPYATPSKVRIIIPTAYRKIRSDWKEDRNRKIYVEDLIARSLAKSITENTLNNREKGLITIDEPGQEILERTAVSVDAEHVTICLTVNLPANGRRINGKEAKYLFFEMMPNVLTGSIFAIKDESFQEVVELSDQHQAIRAEMKKNKWITFVADNAILPRESGISNRPLKNAVPFKSPIANQVKIDLPHREEAISGLAISEGITLIVGGGYHGKSTLLQAMERGVYHHIKGDGREYVLTDPTAVKVRAEDGRKVSGVNISAFIKQLPHQQHTTKFTTDNASGSTSQATNIMEALEAGVGTLLIDEDTSATNFMIRDRRMQELVAKEKEPITPFIDKINQLKDQLGISTIFVMGGSGDYFDIADQVIMMDEYRPKNVTKVAKEIASKYPANRLETKETDFGDIPNRILLQNSIQTYKGKKSRVQAKGLSTIIVGNTAIQLDYLEQLVDSSQTNMIAMLIHYLDKNQILKSEMTIADLLDEIEMQFETEGLASFAPFADKHPGELARPRRFEIAGALNRMRTAIVK